MSGRRHEAHATRAVSETPGVPESLARALERLEAGADRDQAVEGAPPTLRPEVSTLLDARLILPSAPALDPAVRAAIAEEIAGLDAALAPARARTAALRRSAAWSGLVVAVIGLLWAVYGRTDEAQPDRGGGTGEHAATPGLQIGMGADQSDSPTAGEAHVDGDRDPAGEGDAHEDPATVEIGATGEIGENGATASSRDTEATAAIGAGRTADVRDPDSKDGADGALGETRDSDSEESAGTAASERPGNGLPRSPATPLAAATERAGGSDTSATAAVPSTPPPSARGPGGAADERAACAIGPARDRIVGRVVDASGEPAPGRTILVFEEGASSARFFGAGDERGCFALYAIPPGTYRVEVELAPDVGSDRDPTAGVAATEAVAATARVRLDGARAAAPIVLRIH